MDKFVIRGGKRLCGEVEISGAKNAALAILAAAVLADDVSRIENVPNIRDVRIMVQIIKEIGATVRYINKNTIEIDARTVQFTTIPDALTKRLRASYYLIGAMLGRLGKARVAMPGGCNFGTRPIDQHIKGFEALGVRIVTDSAVIDAKAGQMIGSEVYFDVVTVGATVNVMLAAVKARGQTIIENAAKEPHIVDLANFLNFMGADIRGAGTDIIKIRGVDKLVGCTYSIIPDQIEAGTFMVAAAATGGDVLIKNVTPKHLDSISAKLIECGVTIEEHDDCVRVIGRGRPMKCNIKTMPHPGFPTDMQPQMATYLTIAEGTSIISESVWDNRFTYVDQLMRLGASVQVEGKAAIITGIPELKGAPVRADDLRAGAAMVIAGLIARGETEIEDIHHIDRGYEDLVEKLTALGASIERVSIPDPVIDPIPAVTANVG
ncbi:MAG: UDP-N-acetylglucosamine 1-carboxyvinyltransferase [Oscillospiraceae bacterium]|nr:UDP-N-acetylglucosamine 1-carboxyvinyltransferase [Oscillospiraceae bacterium]